MSTKFYFGDGDDDDSEDDGTVDDLASLPFAKPLERSDFLTSEFSPTDYLATLRNRHQTLEDLHAELRTRSSDLSKELLTLVNEHYHDFLSLGTSLKGGDEKIEQAKFGLLSVRREVQTLIAMLDRQKIELEEIIRERRLCREKVMFGRGLLELARRIEDLEEALLLGEDAVAAGRNVHNQVNARKTPPRDECASESENTEEEEEEGDGQEDVRIAVSAQRLIGRVRQFMLIERLAKRLGLQHPFVINCEERRMRLRQTLLLDMNSALKHVLKNDRDDSNRLYMLETYRSLAESSECIKTLHETASQNRKGRMP